ncbi:uncharacterized protein Triagg1_10073 [Trichoderma aggressivum f. europaeum]|uniref:Uncharacterized protein n=1 Tax=Trichoderma aggressivum f. europaeum TaxID=173218 RepID=A0AAE1I9K9_9HYPO|nr:hypothetical protein Triagg1_10073 [Trichoderma aggressivum f. europaeum]
MSSTQITQTPPAPDHPSQPSSSYLKKEEKIKDDHPSTDLFLAVSHAAVQRQQESIQQREKQQCLEQKWREEHVLKPQMEQKAEEKAEKKAKKLVAELFAKELTQRREQRDKTSARNYLSRVEVDEEVHRLVEAVIQGVGMEKRRMEDGTEEPHEVWRERMIALRKQICGVWNDNDGRILMGLPQYVEGYPVRERIRPPIFLALRRQKMSGLRGCLQCEVKGLACSMSVQGRELNHRGCKRCEADGDRCIVDCELIEEEEEEEGKEKEKIVHIWDWWDGAPEREADTDSAAEAVEMWERRRRGARLEPIGGVMQWVEVRGFAPRWVEKQE